MIIGGCLPIRISREGQASQIINVSNVKVVIVL